MPLNIKNEETHLLAKELADLTGDSITEAVTSAIREALERKRGRRESQTLSLVRDLQDIAEFSRSFPIHDSRPADEILGYDGRGIPE